MNVLAIGASGFIGRHVVRQLAELGHQVAVLHRGQTVVDLPDGVHRIPGDRDRLADCRPAVARFAPDVVLDMIAFTEQQVRDLVNLMRNLVGRIVVASSGDVYRNYDGLRGRPTTAPDPTPLTEDAPLRETRYPYRGLGLPFSFAEDYDKILVESVILGEPALPGTVLRLPMVYGPGDAQHRLRAHLRRMDDRRPAILLNAGQESWTWSRGYVENVAAAITLAVADDRSARRVYNLGDATALSERDWIARIGAAAGWDGDVVSVPADQLPPALRVPYDWRYDLDMNTSRIRRELRYVDPVSEQAALERTIAWERSHPDVTEPPDYATEDAALGRE